MREHNGTRTGKLFQPLPRWGIRLIMVFSLIAVAVGFWWGLSYQDRKLRKDFIENARVVSRAIDWRLIRELSASEADLASPAYRRIKEQMSRIHQAAPNNRFVYLLKQRPDGVVIILVDSEPPSSKDYSPPGQVYEEVSPAIRQVFADNRESAVGPVTDRWGTWISAIIPVTDPESGRTVALFGMDIDGRDWYWTLTQETAQSLALILLFVVPLAVYLIQRRRAEQELYDSEERYRMLFNEALVGICMADAKTGIIIDCNQAMADLTGRPIEHLIGAHQTSLHPPQKDNRPYSPTFLQHKDETMGTVLPDQLITASGEIREVEIKARAFAFHGRQVMLGTFNDVTERYRAETALRESKEHYQALYRLIRLMCDNVPDLIWAKDMDRRYIFANKAMCEIMLSAHDTQEPIGRDNTYFSERERSSHPEQPNWHTYGEIAINTDKEVMTTKNTGRFDELGYVKGKQLYLEVSKAPFWDEQGTMIGTVGCGRDVTKVKQLEEEHKKAEELLQHSEERLRRAEAMAHLGHWKLDLKTSIQTWSDEMYRIYGVTPEEFQPTYESIFQLVHPDDHAVRVRAYATVRQEGKTGFEYRVVRPDGEQRIISGTAEMQYDNSGEPEAMFGTVLDITELRLKESELHRKNAEMERFTYTVSHDLRSPLVTIKTFLGFLEQDLAANNPERVTQDVTYIQGAAEKMRRLLDDLIEMSRIGRIVTIPTCFSFREIVEQALVIVAGQIATLGVKVTVHEAELSFFCDRARLTEVWQNLLDNAVKYMGDQPEPRIEIGLSGTGRDTVFFVRDNGIGIAPEHGEKIFGLFEKLDSTSEGTGLGLTLVKRIVEMNGGRIWMESDGVGHGACFRFTLPDALTVQDDQEKGTL